MSNLPNILTLSRIGLIPVLMIAFYMESNIGRAVAAAVFIVACLTDFLDGYVARLLSQTSKLGQFLDPVADKLLVASTLLLLAGFGKIHSVSLLPAIVILCREILVSGLRESLSDIHVNVPITTLAKWKTTIQMLAISCLLISDISSFSLQPLGELFLWIAALLTLITGYDYLRAGIRHLR